MRCPPALCLCCACFASRAGGAEPVPLQVEYEATATCPDEVEFFSAVQARIPNIRPARTEERGQALLIRVTLDGEGPGSWGSLLLVEGGRATGRRRVEGASCREVMEALALATALSLEPIALGDSQPPPPKATPPEPEPTPPEEDPEPRPPRRTPAVRPWTLRFGLAGVAAEPLAPIAFWGGAGEIGAAHRRSGPSVQLSFGVAVGDGRNASMEWQFARSSFHPLRVPFGRVAEFGAGFLAEIGRFRAQGEGLDTTHRAMRGHWGLGVDLRLELTLCPSLAATLDAGTTFRGIERRFTIGDPQEEIAHTPTLVPFAAVGVGVRIPVGKPNAE
ncbi:MAG: hypothetical protein JW751_09545 [Polyangiaceae bacterium]|nr:hypothetical protein [Polyangiaceae bacterium]